MKRKFEGRKFERKFEQKFERKFVLLRQKGIHKRGFRGRSYVILVSLMQGDRKGLPQPKFIKPTSSHWKRTTHPPDSMTKQARSGPEDHRELIRGRHALALARRSSIWTRTLAWLFPESNVLDPWLDWIVPREYKAALLCLPAFQVLDDTTVN